MFGVLLTMGVGERRPCSTWGVGVTHATRGLGLVTDTWSLTPGEADITRPLVEEPDGVTLPLFVILRIRRQKLALAQNVSYIVSLSGQGKC